MDLNKIITMYSATLKIVKNSRIYQGNTPFTQIQTKNFKSYSIHCLVNI